MFTREEKMFSRTKSYLAFGAVVALMAAVPATSSAARFNFKPNRPYTTHALTNQVFTFDSGKTLTCTGADGTGSPQYIDGSAFIVKVKYSGCKLFDVKVLNENISAVEYEYNADGHVILGSPLTATAKSIFYGNMTLKIEPQYNLSAASYINKTPYLEFDNNLGGLTYTYTVFNGSGKGGGSDGTLVGSNLLTPEEGSASWEP